MCVSGVDVWWRGGGSIYEAGEVGTVSTVYSSGVCVVGVVGYQCYSCLGTIVQGYWRCVCTCVPDTPEAVNVCVTCVSVCLTDPLCVVPAVVCVCVCAQDNNLTSSVAILKS